jgi:hypothetical protein
MEKAYALRSAIPELATNGRVAIYQTLDRRVSHIVVIDPSFEWSNRDKQEVFRCGNCNAFILPDEKSITKKGIKFHTICKLHVREKLPKKEIIDAMPNL